MNPFDAVGTARISQAVADRMCRVVLGYQDQAAERAITVTVTGVPRPGGRAVGHGGPGHPYARRPETGSSVRGAIDMTLLLTGLQRLRGDAGVVRETALDAAYAALSGRVRVQDGVDRTAEAVIEEIVDAVWPTEADADRDRGDPGKADGPPPLPAGGSAGRTPNGRGRRERAPGGRTQSRTTLAERHAAFEDVSPEVGELDEGALAAALSEDPDAAAAMLCDLATATDPALRSAARRVAARVFVQLGRGVQQRRRGTRRLAPVRRGEGDLDLERTLDRWSGGWPLPEDDLVTRQWTANRRAVCLAVDTSGSMGGRPISLAAVAAAGVLLAAEDRLEPVVLAFGNDVTVLQPGGARRDAGQVVGELVALRGHGRTDIAAALRRAARELAEAAADERVVVLLSDGIHTAGSDPASALTGIDRLHVLCPDDSPEARDCAAALAARGRGTWRSVTRLADVPPALTAMLS